MSNKNIFIITLGCSKNEIDSEQMMVIVENNNFTIVNSPEEADIIIINTCGFIKDAKEESIDTIWEIVEYKTQGRCEFIILAGCLAERYSKELMEEIEEIDGIIGTGNIKDIVSMILELQKGNHKLKMVNNINEDYLEEVKRTKMSTTKYIKISEGCDNFCTYCIIPALRGTHRSRKIKDIVKEATFLVNNGTREIILIGQNITDYGIDLYGEYRLDKLIDELNKIEKLKWIRLLYLYPDNITNDLINSIKNNDKVVKYLDIPLQHIDDSILKRMNRKTSKNDIEKLIATLRKEIPDIIIRTTFIVGFPGESESNFKNLYKFIEEIKFDRLGIFIYSKEEGTPAYKLDNHIDESIKQYRKDKLMQLQQNISYSLNNKQLGKTYQVLIENKIESNLYSGRTYMDSPDIDGIVFVKTHKKVQCGDFINVRITEALEYDLIGEMTDEFSQ